MIIWAGSAPEVECVTVSWNSASGRPASVDPASVDKTYSRKKESSQTEMTMLCHKEPRNTVQLVRLSTEGDANTNSTSLKIQKAEKVALRTAPAILKHGKKSILVNCFLDEGSDTTYVNEDAVEEFGVQGEK